VTERIRVLVADDHPVWRDGIRGDLERSGVATVIAEAADGREAIVRSAELAPDVILMDLHMPTVDGTDAIREIVRATPDARILVLSVSDDEEDVLASMRSGAAGYLLKTSSAAELVEAVRRVASGESVLPPSLAGLVLSDYRRVSSGSAQRPLPGLTERETEILVHIAKGRTYDEIAKTLYISVKTVQNHVQNMSKKLGLSGRWELMHHAIRKGLDRWPD
jgi:DNA-binding NarL/FixJ family response regulator